MSSGVRLGCPRQRLREWLGTDQFATVQGIDAGSIAVPDLARSRDLLACSQEMQSMAMVARKEMDPPAVFHHERQESRVWHRLAGRGECSLF